MSKLTHVDQEGRVRMVDVTDKKPTSRTAVAQGVVAMNPATFKMIQNQTGKKGNVFETARIAGIMAAKKTSDLIPMCHPLNITHIAIDFYPDKETSTIKIEAVARIFDQTGVEMEALTAVAVAGLTIYDMCKSFDREMIVSDIRLLKKTGGKSGSFARENTNPDIS